MGIMYHTGGWTVGLHAGRTHDELRRYHTLVSAVNLTGGEVTATEKNGQIRVTIPDAGRAAGDTVIKLVTDKNVTRVDGEIKMSSSVINGLDEISTDATYTVSSLVDLWSSEVETLLKGTCRSGFAFHTNDEKNPWIIIDLKKEKSVGAVLIENRSDELQDRAKTLTMWVSSDGKSWVQVWMAEVASGQWTAIPEKIQAGATVKPVQARYIKLGLDTETPTALHLRSVAVFGKD